MKDLSNPRIIKLKGFLFLFLGTFSGLLLFMEASTLKVAFLLGLTIWCFCRAYYFAFYVIEKYVDSNYRFSGLWSFLIYLVNRKQKDGVPKNTESDRFKK